VRAVKLHSPGIGIIIHNMYIGSSFKFSVKVGVEESIVNTSLVGLQIKNTNYATADP
jgi:hypothetical protein